MGWLGQQVSDQPHLPVRTKQIMMPPGEQKRIMPYYYVDFTTLIKLGFSSVFFFK